MIADNFKETAEVITLHGLGFIQIKLQGNQRLHVWHPDLPKRECFEFSSIHSHRFSFMSRVLIGTQKNILYKTQRDNINLDGLLKGEPVTSNATHMSYLHEGQRSQFGNRPWRPNGLVHVKKVSEEIVPAGQRYNMKMHEFHATEPLNGGKTATLMLKTQESDKGAVSLCAIETSPDEDFDRFQLSEKDMWEIVMEVLSGRN
jgi:hypothetical protein